MRWNKFIISVSLFWSAVGVSAGDEMELRPKTTYERHMELRERQWAQLIPNQFVVQNAGNMGILSAGAGWSYGRNHWETHLLFGYIPAHQSTRGKLTMTLKENYIPWDIAITRPQDTSASNLSEGWSVSPLTASLYLNTVYGHEFWKSQPGRYPDKYYDFMSTKFRLNIALGQRVSWEIPSNRRKYAKAISLFYEVSSCDLYIRSWVLDSSVPLRDILGLSVGVKLQVM